MDTVSLLPQFRKTTNDTIKINLSFVVSIIWYFPFFLVLLPKVQSIVLPQMYLQVQYRQSQMPDQTLIVLGVVVANRIRSQSLE